MNAHRLPALSAHIVFMGVSGCGKSSLGAAVASALQLPLVEGDEFHSASNREKMRQGTPLTDEDRADWLQILADQLRTAPAPVALTCSALKRAYRDRLRLAASGLLFVFLDISPQQAQQRVAARAAHFFNPSLVPSQFKALEPPLAEDGVLRVDASEPIDGLCQQVLSWLKVHSGQPPPGDAGLIKA